MRGHASVRAGSLNVPRLFESRTNPSRAVYDGVVNRRTHARSAITLPTRRFPPRGGWTVDGLRAHCRVMPRPTRRQEVPLSPSSPSTPSTGSIDALDRYDRPNASTRSTRSIDRIRSTSNDVIDRSNASTGSTSIDAIDAIERSNAIERSDAIDGIDRTRSIDGAPFPSRRSRKRGRPTSERRSIDLAIRTKEIGCLP